MGDTSNKGTAFYLPGQATVQTDPNETDTTALLLLTENASHTGDSPTGEKGIHMPFRSAMLQSWNKFCFTGGIVEFRAKLPQGGGYWPALWTFGNLGRAAGADECRGQLNCGEDKWIGGVLTKSGKIIGIPYAAETVLEIDPVTRTATTFGVVASPVRRK